MVNYIQTSQLSETRVQKIVQCFVYFVALCIVNSLFVLLSVNAKEPLKSNVPEFCEVINQDGNNDILERLNELKGDKNENFDTAYYTVKDEYHEAINDIFTDKVTKLSNNIYQNGGNNEKICSPFKYEEDTDSLKIAREMVEKFRKYECALMVYVETPPYKGDEVFFDEGVVRLKTVQIRLRQEIRFSYMAMEKTIQMYNELRLWFPIHRDMLCLIEQMKAYRNAVRNFIDQVVRMPAKYYNYGSRYQQ